MVESSDKTQERYWEDIKGARFDWQTEHPFIARYEKRLLSVLNKLSGRTILEVGCGEGPNLVNIDKKYEQYGIDYSKSLLEVAKKKVKDVHFSCQDAMKLKFPDDKFDVVFCRDLIHHVPGRAQVVSEMFRVCKPNGAVVLIESNGANPLCCGLSYVKPAERDLRQITPAHVAKLLKKYNIISWTYAEPLPLYKVFFHYQFGFPSLGKVRLFQGICMVIDKFFALILPKKLWAYMIIHIRK